MPRKRQKKSKLQCGHDLSASVKVASQVASHGPAKGNREALGRLAENGVRVRQKGMEHAMLGTTFDYDQPQVLDLYRGERKGGELSVRCYRCTVEDALGISRATGRVSVASSKIECSECLKLEAELEEKMQQLALEEQRQRDQEDRRISKERAKRQREDYAQMFRPVHLQPLSNQRGLLSKGGESMRTDGEDSDEDSLGELVKEESLYLPPPRQLEALLPIALGSKKDFIRSVKQYKRHRKKLEKLHEQSQEELRLAKLREKAAREVAERKRRCEELTARSIAKMRNRDLSRAFETWFENAYFLKKLRLFGFMSNSRRLDISWRAWKLHHRDWKIEKEVAAIVAQSYIRRHLAKNHVAKKRQIFKAASLIQHFARYVLSRNLAKILRRRARQRETLIQKSLHRLSGNLVAGVFKAWKKRVQLQRHVDILSRRSGAGLVRASFKAWRSHVVLAIRERARMAVLNIQRIGRGFLGKKELKRRRIQHRAAISIQLMVRSGLARNTLRRKMRQRRIVRRKLQRSLGENKRYRFEIWKLHSQQLRCLRFMIQGSRRKLQLYFFSVWASRRLAAIDLQRIVRGFLGRKFALQTKYERLAHLALQGCGSLAEQERMKKLLDPKYSSTLLIKLRHDFLRVRRLIIIQNRRKELSEKWDAQRAQPDYAIIWEMKKKQPSKMISTEELMQLRTELDEEQNDPILKAFPASERNHSDKIVLSIHGTAQQFLISKHGGVLVDILSNDMEAEIERLEKNSAEFQRLMEEESREWIQILENFLGPQRKSFLKNFRTYFRAGKSFDITITTPEEASNTVEEWKRMFKLEYITRWTLLAWIVESVFLKPNVRLTERLLLWAAVQAQFDEDLQRDCAGYFLVRIDALQKEKISKG